MIEDLFRLKLEAGDAIERQQVHWIRSAIPLYEEIWGRYIGNDGENRALELENIDHSFVNERDRFNQCHYSVLISLLILREESERYQHSCGLATSVETYLDVIRDLTSFMAQVGRLRDLFEAISNSLKMGISAWAPFDDLYKARSAVIHGSMVPIQVDGGFVSVPRFETSSHQNSVWSSKAVWADCELSRFTMLSDFMSATFDSACRLTTASFSDVLKRLKQLMPNARLIIKSLPPLSTSTQIVVGSSTITLPGGSGIS
jgi:hypothetical protein